MPSQPTGRPRGTAPKAPAAREAKTGARRSTAKRTVPVEPARPTNTIDLIGALDETVTASEWLRGPDAVSVALLRHVVARITSDAAVAPRLYPIAAALATALGFAPEARARLSLVLDDRKEDDPKPSHSEATRVDF